MTAIRVRNMAQLDKLAKALRGYIATEHGDKWIVLHEYVLPVTVSFEEDTTNG